MRGDDTTRWKPLLDASGAAKLQAMGRTGRGTRLAVVDSDFRGWQALVGKGLPADTRLVDWTAHAISTCFPTRSPPVTDPVPAAPCPHHRSSAPEMNLTLIRIDPDSPYMLEAVARAINGDLVPSINLDNRLAELQSDQKTLDFRRDQLAEERRQVFSTFPAADEAQQRLLKQAEAQKLTPEQVEKLPAFQRFSERERAFVLYSVRQTAYDRELAPRVPSTSGPLPAIQADRLCTSRHPRRGLVVVLARRFPDGRHQHAEPLFRRSPLPGSAVVPGGRRHTRPELVRSIPRFGRQRNYGI